MILINLEVAGPARGPTRSQLFEGPASLWPRLGGYYEE